MDSKTMKNPYKGSRILLVEDEETLALGLEFNLHKEGYAVTRAEDGRRAIELFNSRSFDLIILDIMLPYLDGFEVARVIREQLPQMPILMLTARIEINDKVKSFEIGVDDYMTKPFHLKELLMRVKGMLKRRQWYQSALDGRQNIRFGSNEICFETLQCKTARGDVQLTPHEAMVLKYIIEHEGSIVSRQELLENVWNTSSEVETRTVDNFIMRLRKYFETNPEKPELIVSVRGAGYVYRVNRDAD